MKNMGAKSKLFKIWSDTSELNNIIYLLDRASEQFYEIVGDIHMQNVNIEFEDIIPIAKDKICNLYNDYSGKEVLYKYSPIAHEYNNYVLNLLKDAIMNIGQFSKKYPNYSKGLDQYNVIVDELKSSDKLFTILNLLDKKIYDVETYGPSTVEVNKLIDEYNKELKALGFTASIAYRREDPKLIKKWFDKRRK